MASDLMGVRPATPQYQTNIACIIACYTTVMTAPRSSAEFSFLTNHGKALVLIGHTPGIRIADMASMLQITERSVQRIVTDLATTGYISRARRGRQNVYTVHRHMPLGLPIQRDVDVDALFAILPQLGATPGTPPTVTGVTPTANTVRVRATDELQDQER